MSVWASAWAYEQDIAPMGAKFVLVAMASFAGDDGVVWPGHERLARMTGQTVRSVQKHIATLIADGLVEKLGRRAGSESTAKLYYRICAPPERLTRPGSAERRPEKFSGRQIRAAEPHNRKSFLVVAGDDRKSFPVVSDDDRKLSTRRPESFARTL